MIPHPRLVALYDGLLWALDIAFWGVVIAGAAVAVLVAVKALGRGDEEVPPALPDDEDEEPA